jgi:hypothetical protein
LLGVGNVVAVFHADLLAKDAAGFIDIGGSLVDAVLHLRAGRGVRPGDWAGDAELDLRDGGSRRQPGDGNRKAETET